MTWRTFGLMDMAYRAPSLRAHETDQGHPNYGGTQDGRPGDRKTVQAHPVRRDRLEGRLLLRLQVRVARQAVKAQEDRRPAPARDLAARPERAKARQRHRP